MVTLLLSFERHAGTCQAKMGKEGCGEKEQFSHVQEVAAWTQTGLAPWLPERCSDRVSVAFPVVSPVVQETPTHRGASLLGVMTDTLQVHTCSHCSQTTILGRWVSEGSQVSSKP